MLRKTGMEPSELITGTYFLKHFFSLLIFHAISARGSENKMAGFVAPASFRHARGLQRLPNVGFRPRPDVSCTIFMVETSETRDATIGDFKTRWTRTMRSRTIDVAAQRDPQQDSRDVEYPGISCAPGRTFLSAFVDDQDHDKESEQEGMQSRSRLSHPTGREQKNSIKDHVAPQYLPTSTLCLNPSYISDLPQAPIGGISRSGATVPLRLRDDPASQEDKVSPFLP
jgi:hypothetical protein